MSGRSRARPVSSSHKKFAKLVAGLDFAELAVPDLRGLAFGARTPRTPRSIQHMSFVALQSRDKTPDGRRYPRGDFVLPEDPYMDVPDSSIGLAYARPGRRTEIAAVSGAVIAGKTLLVEQLQGWARHYGGVDWEATFVLAWQDIARRNPELDVERLGILGSRNNPSRFGIGSVAIDDLRGVDLDAPNAPPLLTADDLDELDGAVGAPLLRHAYDDVAIRLGGFEPAADGNWYKSLPPIAG